MQITFGNMAIDLNIFNPCHLPSGVEEEVNFIDAFMKVHPHFGLHACVPLVTQLLDCVFGDQLFLQGEGCNSRAFDMHLPPFHVSLELPNVRNHDIEMSLGVPSSKYHVRASFLTLDYFIDPYSPRVEKYFHLFQENGYLERPRKLEEFQTLCGARGGDILDFWLTFLGRRIFSYRRPQ